MAGATRTPNGINGTNGTHDIHTNGHHGIDGPSTNGAYGTNGHQSHQLKIAIVGGGICGLVLAVALLKRGVQVDIYEQAPAFGEIGAGVAFGPNALRALDACHPSLLSAFNKVATRNESPAKQRVWFDFLDAQRDTASSGPLPAFALVNDTGANSVHRAHFLDQIVALIPQGVAHFGKRLEGIADDPAAGRVRLAFADGTSATADAVVGCDGIKSRTRALMVGPGHAAATPVYTHKYAYRGLVEMGRAAEVLGDDVARNAHIHMGRDGHVLTFPVRHGETFNVVAFRTSADDWPDHARLVLPSTREAAQEDFRGFGASVHKIMGMLDKDLDRWAIFDTGDRPLDAYAKGRVCLVGDAAHASSPHHGAGAGLGVEDAAVMAELLTDVAGRVAADGLDKTMMGDDGVVRTVEAAFRAFDGTRRERTQWLVQSSRRVGDLYEWRAEGVEDDLAAIQQELQWRCEKIWAGDVNAYVLQAKKMLADEMRRVD